MNNGSIWGHGAYLGPDFSAQYLHNLTLDVADYIAKEQYNVPFKELQSEKKEVVNALTRELLKKNRFEPSNKVLHFTEAETKSYNQQIKWWSNYFIQTS